MFLLQNKLTINLVIRGFGFVTYIMSVIYGAVFSTCRASNTQLESLILAQNECWRQA